MNLAADRLRQGRFVAASFFGGVVLGLVVLGTVAAYVGRVLARWDAAFALGAAVFSVAAGVVALLGPVVRRHLSNPKIPNRGGPWGAFVYGLLFSIATLGSSAGPLMLLLTIAAAVGKPAYGALLSLGFGVGRGAPFLLLGLFAGQLGGWISRIEHARRFVEVVSGVALLAIGVYFARLAWLVR